MTASVLPARPRTRWLLPERPDPAVVQSLQDELLLPEPICRLLAARGHSPAESAKRYLRPRLDQLHPPSQLRDLDRAVARLVAAMQGGEIIMIHGDYDVDGMSSTALLTRAFRALGGTVVPFIPHRSDGYDLGDAGVRAARAAGATLVVTCDCGTSAVEPVRALNDMGIDVIISDHHLPGGDLPAAFAVLNPKRPGCESNDKDLAAVGVAFKLALAVTRAMHGNENVVFGMLDFVALATIADMAPLRGENRVFARYGLKLLTETTNPGLRALKRSAGLDSKLLTAGRVSFILAPRLNAVGRLGDPMRGVELLLATTEHDANSIARELGEMNVKRQEMDRRVLEEARSAVRDEFDLDDTYGIVIAREGWHPGVIGIVASHLVEEFGRPVILIGLDGAEGKGSGRSISRFDLHAGIGRCRHLLKRFGGHRSAAGVSIARERVEEFAKCFDASARSVLSPDDLAPELRVDLEVALDELTPAFEALLRHLEPCGMGNPAPMLVSRGVRLAGPPRRVGDGGLKLRLALESGESLDAIGWSLGARIGEIDVARPLDIAYRLERDEYKGVSRLQAKLADFRV